MHKNTIFLFQNSLEFGKTRNIAYYNNDVDLMFKTTVIRFLNHKKSR